MRGTEMQWRGNTMAATARKHMPFHLAAARIQIFSPCSSEETHALSSWRAAISSNGLSKNGRTANPISCRHDRSSDQTISSTSFQIKASSFMKESNERVFEKLSLGLSMRRRDSSPLPLDLYWKRDNFLPPLHPTVETVQESDSPLPLYPHHRNSESYTSKEQFSAAASLLFLASDEQKDICTLEFSALGV